MPNAFSDEALATRPAALKRGRAAGQRLGNVIAHRIVRYAGERAWPRGHHLVAAALAEAFGVSRSPVRDALLHLADLGIVEARPRRGFFLALEGDALTLAGSRLDDIDADDEAPYLSIARDRLLGHLPETCSEAELMRRYQLTRPQLQRILARMAREGWVERKSGYGWSFLPVLTSPEAHAQSYRFRAAIEPAGILEPGFRVDGSAFDRCRAQQRAVLDANIQRLTAAHIFQTGSTLHETLAHCSGNPFILESLQRQNRLRRLFEYRIAVDERRVRIQCKEHLKMLDLIEGGDREAAAELMRSHLARVREYKATHHLDMAPAP